MHCPEFPVAIALFVAFMYTLWVLFERIEKQIHSMQLDIERHNGEFKRIDANCQQLVKQINEMVLAHNALNTHVHDTERNMKILVALLRGVGSDVPVAEVLGAAGANIVVT